MRWARAATLAGLAAWGAVHLLGHLRRAAAAPFTGDERVDLVVSARRSTVGEILARGPLLQPNPAPLNVLALKALDTLRPWTSPVPHRVYYRLAANAAVLLAGLLAFWPLARRLARPRAPLWEAALGLAAMAAYFTAPFTLAFSDDLRAYAFWHAAWFLALAWTVAAPPFPRAAAAPLAAAALSASPGVIQAGALGIGGWCAAGRRRRRAAAAMLLPALAAGLYAFSRVRDWGFLDFPRPQTAHFLSIWLNSPAAWLLPAAGTAFCLWRPPTRRRAAPLAACLLLFLAGPLFLGLIRLKHYQLSFRYFSYYELAAPIYFLTLAACARRWPGETPRWRATFAALALGPALALAPGAWDRGTALARDAGTAFRGLPDADEAEARTLPPEAAWVEAALLAGER